MPKALGPVVQSWISINPGLKVNPTFWFGYICTSVYWKIKLLLNQTRILENYLHVYKPAVGKFALKVLLT
jgi:hypothetical protein